MLGAMLVLILPAALALFEAVSFHIQNRNNGFLVSSGEKREYLLYVPKSYDRTRPTPLVISMHGAGGWPTQQMDLSDWNRLAESQRFIVVYPSGLDNDGPRTWSVDRGNGLMKDVRFISELIDKTRGNLQHRFGENLCKRIFQWRRHVLCAFVHAVRSDRGGRDGWAAQTLPWTCVPTIDLCR